MSLLDVIAKALQDLFGPGGDMTQPPIGPEAKFKHLDLVQAAIARMATNSSLIRGWSLTIATTLAGFAAVNNRSALLAIAIITTALFWGLDGYYLWLERGFIAIHDRVAKTANDKIDFRMAVSKNWAFFRWLRTCLRPHLISFYGVIITVEVIGIFVIRRHS